MPVQLNNLSKAVDALVKLGARKVTLLGTAAESPERARDIDLAVEGIPPNRILDADVAVMDVLQQPFDLVARETNPVFFNVILRYGKVLYG